MQRNNRMNRKEPSEFKERLVSLNRVTKVVKGGRNMRFAALMVVGDEKGRVGCGIGKSTEISDAIRKGAAVAKKNLINVPMKDTTIPHEAKGKFGTAQVTLLPAEEGAGLIAGGAARAVLELSGIKDIRTKSYGSSNRVNTVKATIDGLKNLMSPETVAKNRGKAVEEIVD